MGGEGGNQAFARGGMMRPISLTDESLDDLDQDEKDRFDKASYSEYGRRRLPVDDDDLFDERDDEGEDLPDLCDILGEGDDE